MRVKPTECMTLAALAFLAAMAPNHAARNVALGLLAFQALLIFATRPGSWVARRQ